MKKKKSIYKNKTTAMVCRYIMNTKKISGRTMAKKLGVHFTTWHRYARGETRPDRRIKAQLVMIMQVGSFLELIQLALKSPHRIS